MAIILLPIFASNMLTATRNRTRVAGNMCPVACCPSVNAALGLGLWYWPVLFLYSHCFYFNPLTVTIFTTVFGNRGRGKITHSLSQVLVHQLLTKFQRLYPYFRCMVPDSHSTVMQHHRKFSAANPRWRPPNRKYFYLNVGIR